MVHRSALSSALLAALAALVLFPAPGAAQVSAASKKYTTTADFNLGTLFNVDTSVPNQLQLATVVTTFNLMWIANAGEDTVSKIDTTTGKELGRYKTWFTGSGPYGNHFGDPYQAAAPSRTAVDSEGNVYVANRHFDGRNPVVLKILSSGFIDRNSNGTAETSADANNNGKIEPGEMLPLVDTNLNGVIDPGEIQDERIAWATAIPQANGLGRSLAIDPDGNIWAGLFNSQAYYKLNGSTGAIMSGPHSTIGNTPYGALIDANRILWGASLNNNLLKLDTSDPDNPAKKVIYGLPRQNYGIAAGFQTGIQHIYMGAFNGGRYIDFNTATNTASTPGTGFDFGGIGIATNGVGEIFVAYSNGLVKYASTGAQLWAAGLQPGTFDAWGVVIDADQNAWLIHRMYGSGPPGKIAKYRGSDGAHLGVFDVGSNPYTYSDATGIQRFTSQREGRWTVVQTAGIASDAWFVKWNTEPQGSVPAGTSLVVDARAAASQGALNALPFTRMSNGTGACVVGNFVEVRATLTSTTSATPVLSDATVYGKCDPNMDGMVNSVDINLINAARNTPSSGACDLRDADANGTITVNDSRQCALKCTKPNCAI
jgi:hypothetical protein